MAVTWKRLAYHDEIPSGAGSAMPAAWFLGGDEGGAEAAAAGDTARYTMNTGGSVPTGYFGGVVDVDSGSDQVLQLPALATVVGKRLGVAKLGAGRVTITAPAGASIQDSGPGGTIYCASGEMARIELEVLSSTQIGIVSGVNDWTTTE